MTPTTPAYDALAADCARLHRFEHLQALAQWDRAALMPPRGNEARAAALAELAALLQGLQAEPARGERIARAAGEPLTPAQRANLREIERDWRQASALPAALVARREQACARCEHAWRSQRAANDWAGFVVNFRAVLAIVREEAARLSDAGGLAPYDALIDRYEPGMRSAVVDRLFADLWQWLPGLIAQVRERQAGEPVLAPRGPFAVDAQRRLCERVLRELGFDFDAGRLDVSAHPFCGGVPEDVRITTRYSGDDFLGSLMGTIHECGHARYEQNLPPAWRGQPAGRARSMAIHESQSLAFEMQLAVHPGWVRRLAPLLAEAFGAQPAFEPANLQRLLTRVQPGRIRVDADELSYPAHVILRYEIERALIAGDAEADDVPALWDAKMQALLGIDTRGDLRDGPLQDVHWAEGAFGYFPCYTLGAMYAAQWFAALRREQPGFDARIGAGDLQPVFEGLHARLWSQGSLWPTDELVQRASGEPLNPAHYRAHLQARYLGG